MSVSTVITGGFGSGGSPSLIILDGYGGTTVDPLFRGHIRRGRHRRYYDEPEIREAIGRQAQDELAVHAARIAREEIEADKAKARLAVHEQELGKIENGIARLAAKSAYVARQAEILQELLEIQKIIKEDEDDIAEILMLL